jgi:predicted phage tail protein
LTARVVNIGAADAAASAVVFRAGGVDGAVLGAATVPALAMGQESDVTATWNGAGTTPKPFIFVATADEAATLTEFDESNNRIEIRFGVSEPVGTIASELAATVSLRGAALDLGARASGSGTGASAVRVSVKAGGVEITSLDASYGASRPEIAALYGAQFLASGYEVTGIALAPGVYDVTVSALSAISGQRVVVATDRITISTAVPVAPTNLASTVRGSTVTLSWQAPASGAAPTGYVIEGGSAQGRADLAVLPTGSTATTITVPGVPAGAFFVRVRGVNQAGQGAASPDIVVTVGGVRCPVPPGAPTNLQSTVTGRQVRLAWTGGDGLCAATGFVVQAGSAKGLSNIAAITVAAAPTVLDVIDVPVGTYFVRLVAINGSGASAASNEVRLDVGGGCPSPSAPGGLVSTVAPDRTVALTWQVPTAAVTGVQIEAGSASGSANLAVLPLSGTATSYSTVAPPGKYFVRVRASNACGLGDASNEVVVIVP